MTYLGVSVGSVPVGSGGFLGEFLDTKTPIVKERGD